MAERPAPGATPVLAARRLVKHFVLRDGFRRRQVAAVAGIDLEVYRGECLALVGESGCGKTTLGKCLVGHLRPDGGRVEHAGVDLAGLGGGSWRRLRRRLQLVFQDSGTAFDPRLTIARSLAEAFPPEVRRQPRAIRDRAGEMLESVDLDRDLLERYPHQLSGGQRQRLGIARALAAEAEVLVLDEPVSALDASVRGQILDLLRQLRRQLGVTLVFIGHDLGVVREIADRVAVLYLGRIVEIGPAPVVLSRPSHPYTSALLDAVPSLQARAASRQVLAGDVPSAVDPPPGCPFHPRCPRAASRCRTELPVLRSVGGPPSIHRQACHLPLHEPHQPADC